MSAVCSVHGKSRTMGNLEEDGLGGFKCLITHACNTGGKGGTGAPQDGASCSVHGKHRTTANLMQDGFGGMCCKPGYECQGGTGGGSSSNFGGSVITPPVRPHVQAQQFEQAVFGGSVTCGQPWVDNLQNKMLSGDWNCESCGDHQFAKNANCRKCGAAKPDNPAPGPLMSKGIPNAKGGKGGMGGKGGKEGKMDMMWKMMMTMMGGGDSWNSAPATGGVIPGAWGKSGKSGKGGKGGKDSGDQGEGAVCSAHGKFRTGSNLTDDGFGAKCCKPGFECQTSGGGGGPSRPPPSLDWVNNLQNKMMSGDWNCESCGDHQFAKNVSCRKCGAARPEGAGQVAMIAGDWECPGCGDHQFARNQTCRKCGAAKPAAGEMDMGPYGAG